jgi:(2R)-3-sulfolactate dehydrogenase (NADP+)
MTVQSIETIRQTTKTALCRHGAEDWIAEHVADAVAMAESVGNKICGLYYVESYCQQLKTGRVDGHAVPCVSQPRPAVVYVDAKFGFAQPAFARGLGRAVDVARAQGIAVLSVGHAHTCTSLGYFTGQIAEHGLIGLGFTNASPIVAAPGGRKRVIGTNPIAFSVPDGEGGVALQFDQSTTTVALGKITMAKAAGEKIPLGWAVDADGKPTDDPEAALAGSLVSMGGHKGWGFGVMAELLASGLTGSVRSLEVKPLKAPDGPPHDLGQYYILIDPGQEGAFQDRLHKLADAVEQDEGTRLPGRGKTPMTEVDVADSVWELITRLAG